MLKRIAFGFAAILVAMVVAGGGAKAHEKRIALLIGNQSYDASVGTLKNPHNDIALVAAALGRQGFEILPLVKDAHRSAILGAVRQLAARLKALGPGAIGFLYYSGHGAAEKDNNINYVIPVDAKDPGSTQFWDESVKLSDIMSLLDGASRAVKFVVFDACRNELQLPTRDTSKGLVPVAEQQGYFVAYASAPGRTASDRGEKSGPYAAALASQLARGGLDHLDLFQNVKEAVIANTGGRQHPWESNGLSKRVYLTGEPTLPADIALWESVRSSNDPVSLNRYLDRFPRGVFAATAQQMIARLKAEAAERDATARRLAEAEASRSRQAAALSRAQEEARQARAARAAAEEAAKRATATRQAQASETDQASADALNAAQARLTIAEQRLAALEEASRKQEQERRVRQPGPFDGSWRLELERNENCGSLPESARLTSTWWIEGETVLAPRGGRGTIMPTGEMSVRWPHPSIQGRIEAMTARLTGESGQGTWVSDINQPGGCGGTVSWTRQVAPPTVSDTQPSAASGPFDGTWILRGTSKDCRFKRTNQRIVVSGRLAKIFRSSGNVTGEVQISPDSFHLTAPNPNGKTKVLFVGKPNGDGYTGTYFTANRSCSGVFTARRQ